MHPFSLTVVLSIALMQVGWAQAIVETLQDGPHAESPDTQLNILVLLQHPQPALLGPHALEIQRDRPRATYRDTWGKPAIWRLIGQTQDGRQRVAAADTDLSPPEVFDELVARFDFVGATVNSVTQFDTESNWFIQAIDRTSFIGLESGKWLDARLVRQLLYQTDLDGVMSTRYTYFMTPDLRQVRLVTEIRLHLRAAKEPGKYYTAMKRRYEYLSPTQGNGLRAWRSGEKEAFKQIVEQDYVDRSKQYPHNEAAYRKDRNKVQAVLRRGSENILLPDGLLEAWSPTDLHAALSVAAERMANMIHTDLSRLTENELVEGNMLTVTALQLDGDPKRIRAREFFRDATNTVFQTGGGNLYSLPTAK